MIREVSLEIYEALFFRPVLHGRQWVFRQCYLVQLQL